MRYMPLSEERIVSELIRNRYKLESHRGNDDVVCLYIDLDR